MLAEIDAMIGRDSTSGARQLRFKRVEDAKQLIFSGAALKACTRAGGWVGCGGSDFRRRAGPEKWSVASVRSVGGPDRRHPIICRAEDFSSTLAA
jgi:hypothetical protein